MLITESLLVRLSAVPVKQVFGRHFPRASDVCVCFVYYENQYNVDLMGVFFCLEEPVTGLRALLWR